MNNIKLSIALLLVAFSPAIAQQKSKLVPENRTISALKEKAGVHLSAAEGSGIAWVKDVTFTNGTIEIDLRGKNVKQGSFIGVAFHGISKDDCEAVYFRPFNFVATDSLARMHMVQYVQDTLYGWERLRDEHPGVYENKLATPPDPNNWFHVKVVVEGTSIKAYVNNTLCLSVTSLNKKNTGKLGLWVGNGSDGDFANLKIKHN
ncbi:family 16 glycoside hydrolase [Chitinophaga sancti]|uniref:family 16 glycoside hydrolase n=1 Tax=Chitinophaga sancti TaxID=1004 RepID=UPI003F79BC0D